jgi:hypothetical protein
MLRVDVTATDTKFSNISGLDNTMTWEVGQANSGHGTFIWNGGGAGEMARLVGGGLSLGKTSLAGGVTGIALLTSGQARLDTTAAVNFIANRIGSAGTEYGDNWLMRTNGADILTFGTQSGKAIITAKKAADMLVLSAPATTAGTRIGETGEKVGFLGAQPVVRPTLPASGVVTAADIRAILITLGLAV